LIPNLHFPRGALAPFLLAFRLMSAPASAAAAEAEHPPVYLKLDPCVPVQYEAVRQVLAVEFGGLYAQEDAPEGGVTRVIVDCADTQIWLRVDDPLTGKSLLRRLDLWRVDPGVRARLLGLAITELVIVSWTELMANPKSSASDPEPVVRIQTEPVPPTVAVLAHPEPAPKKLGDAQGLYLLGVASMTTFFSNSGPLWGGGMRLGWSNERHLGWDADLVAQHGNASTNLGGVSIDALSLSGALLSSWRWSRLALQLGGGFRGGVAYLDGHPLSLELIKGSSLWGPFGGPMLEGGVNVRLRHRLLVQAHLEGGYALLSVIGNVTGALPVALDGFWLGAQLGIGIFP
jgi:hypothetical protein